MGSFASDAQCFSTSMLLGETLISDKVSSSFCTCDATSASFGQSIRARTIRTSILAVYSLARASMSETLHAQTPIGKPKNAHPTSSNKCVLPEFKIHMPPSFSKMSVLPGRSARSNKSKVNDPGECARICKVVWVVECNFNVSVCGCSSLSAWMENPHHWRRLF